MNIVFTVMKTRNMKQIQKAQELKLADCGKLEMEIHCIKLQIQAHQNNVPKRRDFKRSKGLSISSKVWVFCS